MSLLLNTPHSGSVVRPISSTMQHRPRIWQGPSSLLGSSGSSTSCSDWAPTSSLATRDSADSSSAITSRHLKFLEDGKLWVESGAVMAELIPQAVERGLVGIGALRRNPEHRGRRGLAESALPVAGSRTRANDVHRRGLRVGRAVNPRRQTKDRRPGLHAVRIRHEHSS